MHYLRWEMEDLAMNNTFLCAICAAEFASSAELVKHERDTHTADSARAASSENSYDADEGNEKPRKDRSFTRRHTE